MQPYSNSTLNFSPRGPSTTKLIFFTAHITYVPLPSRGFTASSDYTVCHFQNRTTHGYLDMKVVSLTSKVDPPSLTYFSSPHSPLSSDRGIYGLSKGCHLYPSNAVGLIFLPIPLIGLGYKGGLIWY